MKVFCCVMASRATRFFCSGAIDFVEHKEGEKNGNIHRWHSSKVVKVDSILDEGGRSKIRPNAYILPWFACLERYTGLNHAENSA